VVYFSLLVSCFELLKLLVVRVELSYSVQVFGRIVLQITPIRVSSPRL